MKIEVSEEWMEEKNGENAHHKYSIRGFEGHLQSDVAVVVADVICFVLLLCWLFKNKREIKMKLEVSGELRQQENGRNAHR